jgi:hypothetical protein
MGLWTARPPRPFSPDVGKPPENGFISEPFSPDVGKPPENGSQLPSVIRDPGDKR